MNNRKFQIKSLIILVTLLLATGSLLSCNQTSTPDTGAKKITIGVSFETLQTEYWVAGFEAIKAELKKRDATVLEAIADGDANRQLEQVNNFITRKVDGIIAVPKDAKTIIPMIKAANQANIPIVLYNRPADQTEAKSVAVVADNFAITKATVEYMAEQAKKSGKKYKAAILIGDLGDTNAVGRRDGFEAAIKSYSDVIEVVARIPTEWNGEKARAGMTNALQAHPEINFIFTSSDFMFPQIVQALKAADKYHKIGAAGHVLLGGFDGDATAYQMLVDGYLDADGVQDVYFESEAAVQAILDLKAGKSVAPKILDPGFVIHQGNLKEASAKMWGAQVKK